MLTVIPSVAVLVWVLGPATRPVPGPADPVARAMSEVARGALDVCGDDCRPVAAEAWRLRRRVATVEELRSLAVQVEQGDEACLCGKTHATLPEVERQAQLLAEATLLFHLVGDSPAAEYNLARLRNVAHKSLDTPAAGELLVRMSALLRGADAGLREISPVQDDGLRLHLPAAAATSGALPAETRRTLLREALRSPLEKFAGLERGTLTAVLLAMEEVGLSEDAGRVVRSLPAELREAVTRDRDALRAARRSGGGAVSPAPHIAQGVEAYRRGDLRGAVTAWTSGDKELVTYELATAGRLSAAADAKRLTAVASMIENPAARAAFAAAAGLELTKGSERVRYEDLFVTHSYEK